MSFTVTTRVAMAHLRGRRQLSPPGSPHPTATSPANPTTTSAVRGEASLVSCAARRLHRVADVDSGTRPATPTRPTSLPNSPSAGHCRTAAPSYPLARPRPSWWWAATVPSLAASSCTCALRPDRNANPPRSKWRQGWAVPQAGREDCLVTSSPCRPRGTPRLLRRCCVVRMAIGRSGFQCHLGCKRSSDPGNSAHDRQAAGARRRSSARARLRAPSH
jgi:hypothetical protein